MKLKSGKLGITCVLLFSGLLTGIHAGARDMAIRLADSIMSQGSSNNISDYIDATAMKGFRQLWLATGNDKYYQYIHTGADNNLWFYNNIVNSGTHDIDPVNGGSLLLFMYARTGEAGYRNAARSTLNYLKSFPRSSDGGFFHKDWPRMQVDDLYMGAPFLAEYGQIFNLPAEYADAVKQTVLMEKHTRDPQTGLYYHAWYETPWRDDMGRYFEAGCTDFFWGRGVGWVAMALIDVLDFLPAEHSDRNTVITILQRLALALKNVQDSASGVWWQVLDQGGRSGNFLESSGSCMFVYALAKGVRLGYLDPAYRDVAVKGYNGIIKNFVRENSNGTITITKVCPGQAPGLDYKDYVRFPYENGHAVGPFILASIEMETSTPPVTPVPTGITSPTPSPAVSTGDVNGDGAVTIIDALLTAQYYVGLNPTGFNPAGADVNCDGVITIVDALLIARYYVGLSSGFAC